MNCFEKHPFPVLILGVIGTALSAIFVKYSAAPAIIIATYRLLWTVFLMTPFIVCNDRFIEELKSIKIKTLFLCALSGISLALHFTLWFESLNYTSVACSTVIVCTEAIWVALGFHIFLHGTISKKAWISIFITISGSVIITIADIPAGVNSLYGNLLAMISSLFASVYTLLGTSLRSKMTTTAYTYIVYVFCMISLCTSVLISGLAFTGHGTSAIIVGLLLCIFSTLLGHSIFSWCLKFLSPAFVSACKLCQPIVSALLALFLFSEIPSELQIVGGAITLLGIVLYSNAESN